MKSTIIIQHSSKSSAWNIINTQLGAKRKVAIVPYAQDPKMSAKLNELVKSEAYEDAVLIRDLFNNTLNQFHG